MPTCGNCDSFVTSQYVRVFTPDDHDQPRVCPKCEDKVREGGTIRDAKSQRRVEQREYQNQDRSKDEDDD